MYVTNAICTELILRHVSADFAYIVWEFLKPEEITYICHLCYILQQIIMFYLLICILHCASKFKDQ